MSSMQLTVTSKSTAAPEDVYSVLADVHSHRQWAGEKQFRPFRLADLREEPTGPAQDHDTWSSSGRIPMHLHNWEDHSCVTVAAAPRRFEYTTEARIPRSRGRSHRQATYRHHYEIESNGRGGSRVAYTITEEDSRHPLLRVALPGIREVTWATGVRVMAGRGLRNITKLAEARRPPTQTAPRDHRRTPQRRVREGGTPKGWVRGQRRRLRRPTPEVAAAELVLIPREGRPGALAVIHLTNQRSSRMSP